MADTKLTPQQVADLRRKAGKYNRLTDEVDKTRGELDGLVSGARGSGGTFREIASICGRSVAWVQGSVERSKR